MNIIFFIPLLIAFLITAVLTYCLIPLIKKLGILDDPTTHQHPAMLHHKPIPRAGGVPFFLGVLITGIFFLPVTPITIALFSAAFIALVVGVLDDMFDISPYIRLTSNVVVGGILVLSGVGINFVTNPLGGVLHLDTFVLPFTILGLHFIISLSDIIALVWIVWVMNMLNWSKGVDGQMPGIVAISSIVIGILSLRFPVADTNSLIAAHLSFIIAGASLGFLVFNKFPAKIFPGYSATSIYLLLSVVSILSGAKLATAILVMGVPMIDGVFTIFRRVIKGKSPFKHDKKHLHHILFKLGWGQQKIALFYWCISAILGAISLLLTSQGKIYVIIMLCVIVGGGLLFLHFVLENKDE